MGMRRLSRRPSTCRCASALPAAPSQPCQHISTTCTVSPGSQSPSLQCLTGAKWLTLSLQGARAWWRTTACAVATRLCKTWCPHWGRLAIPVVCCCMSPGCKPCQAGAIPSGPGGCPLSARAGPFPRSGATPRCTQACALTGTLTSSDRALCRLWSRSSSARWPSRTSRRRSRRRRRS